MYALFLNFSHAQDSLPPASTACTISPTTCAKNLKNVLYPSIDSLTLSYFKTTTSSTIPYNDPAYKLEGCHSITSDGCQDNTLLKYKVFYPVGPDYTTCSLPAVIMFHGGGFKDCSNYTNTNAPDFNDICRSLTKRGFVVFNVEYRRGVILAPDNSFTAQQVLAIYRAAQDARGAIKSIVQRQNNEATFNDPYRINVNQLFIGGQSAGSLTAMNVAYYQTQGMINQVFPGAQAVLGDIDIDYYYGDTSTPYKIKGVFNMWGGLPIPPNRINNPLLFFAADSYYPPMIAFHGRLDLTFDIDSEAVSFSGSNSNVNGVIVNSTSQCLSSTFTLYPANPSPDFYFLGSRKFYQLLKDNGYAAELYIDCQMGHGLNSNDPTKNDFGTGFTNSADVNVYMVQRAATFFQAVMTNYVTSLTITKFTECPNDRVRCFPPPVTNTCPTDADNEHQDIDCPRSMQP